MPSRFAVAMQDREVLVTPVQEVPNTRVPEAVPIRGLADLDILGRAVPTTPVLAVVHTLAPEVLLTLDLVVEQTLALEGHVMPAPVGHAMPALAAEHIQVLAVEAVARECASNRVKE
jgi:hypothetical protein